jgi:hypothetical protein
VTTNCIFLPDPTHYVPAQHTTPRRQFIFTLYCVLLLLLHKKSRSLEILRHLEVLDICLHVLSTPSFTVLSLIHPHTIITQDNPDSCSATAILATTFLAVHMTAVHNSPLEEIIATYEYSLTFCELRSYTEVTERSPVDSVGNDTQKLPLCLLVYSLTVATDLCQTPQRSCR